MDDSIRGSQDVTGLGVQRTVRPYESNFDSLLESEFGLVGALGGVWGGLGGSLGFSDSLWAVLGSFWGVLGSSWGVFGPSWSALWLVLGASWGVSGRLRTFLDIQKRKNVIY